MLSGDYFDDITLWFSDTFPGREDWMSLSRYVSSFHGYSEIAVEGELTMSDVIISPYLTATQAVDGNDMFKGRLK